MYPCSPPGLLRPFETTDFSVNLITSVNPLPRKKHIHPCNHIQSLAIPRLQKLIHGSQFRNPSLRHGCGRDTCLQRFPGEEGAEEGKGGRISYCLIGSCTGRCPRCGWVEIRHQMPVSLTIQSSKFINSSSGFFLYLSPFPPPFKMKDRFNILK